MGSKESKSTGNHGFSHQMLVHGLRGSGKSNVCARMRFEDTCTPFTDFGKYMLEYGGRIPLYHIVTVKSKRRVDSVGLWEESLSLLGPHLKVHGLVFCVDSSDRERMGEARELLQDVMAKEGLQGLPLLVYANKQDISGSMNAKEVEEALQLDIIKGRPYHVQGCSALSGAGLWEGLEWFVRRRQRTDEKREAVQGPVKETLEDGKTMLKSGHSWIGNLFTRATATTS